MRPGEQALFVLCGHEQAVRELRALRDGITQTEPLPAPLPALCAYELEPCAGGVIDLNADAGEGYDDAGCLQYVTSVTVAPPRTFLEAARRLL